MTKKTALARPDVQRASHPDWFHVTTTNDGATQLNVNVLRMPPPERSLMANATAVSREGRSITLVFGQTLPGVSRMLGALVVIMPVAQLHQTVHGHDDFMRSLQSFAERHKIIPTERHPVAETFPAERVVVERASLVAITFAEDEAELRFFRTSPTDVRALSTGEGQDKVEVIYPVVQVMLDTSELVHLLHSLAKLIPREPT